MGRILLLTALVAAFLLRETSARHEPFPAVLLPSGGSVAVRSERGVRTWRLQLTAVAPDGGERELDPGEFFSPIPSQYWTHIAGAAFGLGRDHARPSETRAWLRARAEAIGVPDARALKVRYLVLWVDPREREVVGRRVLRTIEVSLHG